MIDHEDCVIDHGDYMMIDHEDYMIDHEDCMIGHEDCMIDHEDYMTAPLLQFENSLIFLIGSPNDIFCVSLIQIQYDAYLSTPGVDCMSMQIAGTLKAEATCHSSYSDVLCVVCAGVVY